MQIGNAKAHNNSNQVEKHLINFKITIWLMYE